MLITIGWVMNYDGISSVILMIYKVQEKVSLNIPHIQRGKKIQMS